MFLLYLISHFTSDVNEKYLVWDIMYRSLGTSAFHSASNTVGRLHYLFRYYARLAVIRYVSYENIL
jgi:hypothetical protein